MQGVQSERITTAGVMIQKGKVFIARRQQGGSIGGHWEFPGGKNRDGENPAQTLVREFMEEFALNIQVHEFLHGHDFVNKGVLYHLQAYRVSLLDTVFEPRLTVHDRWRWVDRNEIGSYDFAPSDAEIVRSLLLSALI